MVNSKDVSWTLSNLRNERVPRAPKMFLIGPFRQNLRREIEIPVFVIAGRTEDNKIEFFVSTWRTC